MRVVVEPSRGFGGVLLLGFLRATMLNLRFFMLVFARRMLKTVGLYVESCF